MEKPGFLRIKKKRRHKFLTSEMKERTSFVMFIMSPMNIIKKMVKNTNLNPQI